MSGLRTLYLALPLLIAVASTAVAEDNRAICKDGPREKAIPACTRMIEAPNAKPQDQIFAYMNRGIKYRLAGDYDRAIADFDAIIKLDPKHPQAHGQRGWAYQYKRDFDRATADADEALRLDPKLDQPYVTRGVAIRGKSNDIAAAMIEFDKAIAANPNNMLAYYYRGLAQRDKGDLDRALADLDAAVRLDPKYGMAFFYRALAYRDKGENDLAIADLDTSIKLSPGYAPAWGNRAYIYLRKRDNDRVIADSSEAIRLNPKIDYPYYNRGIGFQNKGDTARALADFDAAIGVNPRYTSALNRRALLLESAGDNAKALADFKAALAIDPKLPGAAERIRRLEEKIAARSEPVPPASPGASEARVALVIGNSAYTNVQKLSNPKGDSEKIAATLKQIGFANVTLAHDLTREKLTDALKTFAREAAKADWALVYFAGHGIEFDGRNFLIPIEAKLESDRDISFEAVALDQVLLSVEGARKLRLVILDACRDNPFAKTINRSIGTRSVGRGLALVEPDGATLVAYAAKHGQYALDGEPGANSPFVRALVKHLETPGVEISLLFRKVRDEVMAATGRKQEPFTYGSLPSEELFFRRK